MNTNENNSLFKGVVNVSVNKDGSLNAFYQVSWHKDADNHVLSMAFVQAELLKDEIKNSMVTDNSIDVCGSDDEMQED